jgi:Na+-driven multidrug efflux pump
MRPELLGSLLVACVSTIVVLATYRAEKKEKFVKKVFVISLSALFSFGLAFVILYLFFTYSSYGAHMNVISGEPDF